MNTHADKTQENKTPSGLNADNQMRGNISTFQFVDNRSETLVQRKFQEMVNEGNKAKQVFSVGTQGFQTFNSVTTATAVVQRQGDEDTTWQLQADEFLNTYTIVNQDELKSEEPDLELPQLMILTGPITGAASRIAELKTAEMPQHLKALVPWSHKRKNWIRGVNALEGATDIAWNGASLGSSSLSLGAASAGTAAIGAGYKTGFSVAKSRIRRESKGRTAVKAGSVAGSEFTQALIPYVGSAWGIGSGIKQLAQTKSLDSIARERKGERAVLGILNKRITRCLELLGRNQMDREFRSSSHPVGAKKDLNPEEKLHSEFEESSLELQYLNRNPKTVKQLESALEWLNRQKDKSVTRFSQIDSK